MKRKLGLTAALVCAMALVGYAQSKPDFSGTWTLDASKSEMGDMGGGGGGGRMGRGMMGGPITITQTADALTIEREGRNGPMKTTYKLDGTETEVRAGRGATGKAKAHWEGSNLVIETTAEGPNGSMTIKETRSLAADGTMVVARETPRGAMKLVYTKQK
ncbi:MAG TPA: hypothetical protein VFK20_07325 [Vicinamibacterales bacterium]|nr:hypothetical protein [Vicinamibacterales bacterium]